MKVLASTATHVGLDKRTLIFRVEAQPDNY